MPKNYQDFPHEVDGDVMTARRLTEGLEPNIPRIRLDREALRRMKPPDPHAAITNRSDISDPGAELAKFDDRLFSIIANLRKLETVAREKRAEIETILNDKF